MMTASEGPKCSTGLFSFHIHLYASPTAQQPDTLLRLPAHHQVCTHPTRERVQTSFQGFSALNPSSAGKETRSKYKAGVPRFQL